MLAYIWLSAFLAIAQRESLTLARTSATTVGPTVKLDYGTFTGEVNETTKIISFRGIRYADAPLGDLRWRAPISPPSLQLGEVNATEFGNSCIQTPQSTVLSGFSEDCLFGNVYVPANTSTGSNLPILVWFHGGGFQEGDTHDAPPELILHSSVKPLIFVSFEYRLGQFGFLGGSRIAANGALNVGLLDQRAALRWVQRYISKFGGDPSLVTIWGESAGAGSTMFHLLANGGDNEGLFRAAMGDSPSLNYMPFFDEPYDEEIFDQFAALAGCMGSDEMTLECLRSANSSVLTAAGSQLITSRPATLFVFAPILDGVLLRERPVEAFADGHFSQVPVLFGSNTDEGANWSASLADPNANTSMPNATEQTVFNFLQGQYANMTEASMNKAIMHYPLRSFASSFSLQGQQMYGEARYICTAVMITGSASRQRLPAYHFHYDNPDLGSNHGADLQAFFQPLPADASPADSALFVAMREMWTSFVTSGVPTASREISWLPATSSNGSPRILLHPGGIQMEDVDETLSTCCDFWHSLDMQLHT